MIPIYIAIIGMFLVFIVIIYLYLQILTLHREKQACAMLHKIRGTNEYYDHHSSVYVLQAEEN